MEGMYTHLHSIPACDRQTYRRTSYDGIVSAMDTHRAVKTDKTFLGQKVKVKVSGAEMLIIFSAYFREKCIDSRKTKTMVTLVLRCTFCPV